MAAQHATSVQALAALIAGQKFIYRSTFRAVRALVVPPERGQGTETGKFLDSAVTDFGAIPCEASWPWNSPIEP